MLYRMIFFIWVASLFFTPKIVYALPSLQSLSLQVMYKLLSQELELIDSLEREPSPFIQELAQIFGQEIVYMNLKDDTFWPLLLDYNAQLLETIDSPELFWSFYAPVIRIVSPDDHSSSISMIKYIAPDFFLALTVDNQFLCGSLTDHSLRVILTQTIDALLCKNSFIYLTENQNVQSESYFFPAQSSKKIGELFAVFNRNERNFLSAHEEKELVFLGDSSGVLKVFDLSCDRLKKELSPLSYPCSAIAMSLDGSIVVRADWNGSFFFFNYDTDKEWIARPSGILAKINDFCFISDHELVLLDHLGNLLYWDIRTTGCHTIATEVPVALLAHVSLLKRAFIYIDRQDRLFCAHVLNSSGRLSIKKYLLSHCSPEPTALKSSPEGLLYIGHKDGSVSIDRSFVMLCSLSLLQIKLCVLFFKKQQTKSILPDQLAHTWHQLYMSLPSEYSFNPA